MRRAARPLRYAGRNAIALAAIFVSLAGTAAASHLVVRASDIQADAVRAKHIAEDSVRQKQVHRDNLARQFGSGILAGEVLSFAIPAGTSGDEKRSPLGASASVAESFSLVAPRRMVVRDFAADARDPVVRRVNVRVRKLGDGGGLMGCVIEIGETACRSAPAARLVIGRGSRFDLWIGDLGPGNVDMEENVYRFAYRVVP